jgi:sporulation integral membrane protein YtvI
VLIEVKNIFMQVMSSAGDLLNTVVGAVSKWAASVVTGIPNFIWSTVICLVATAFFAVDYSKISCVLSNLIPSEYRDGSVKMAKSALSAIPKFIRGYALVLMITFAEVFVWLLILKVEKPLLIALIIALLDILPILGTGTVVIPWAIFSLLTGQIGRGILLGIMYMTITIVRQYVEPKIIGHEIGVYPIVTLLSMFIARNCLA